jgi:hypothetical protein
MRLGSLDGEEKRLVSSGLQFTKSTFTDFHVGGRLSERDELYARMLSIIIRSVNQAKAK